MQGLAIVLLLATACAGSNVTLKGQHVCKKQETFTMTLKVAVKEPVTIRTYVWCMKVPPRCSQYRTEMRDAFKTQSEQRTREVESCCEGYAPDSSNECVAQCPGCLHGACVEPRTCSCKPGYVGPLCDTQCPAGRWGANCTETCTCLSNASCDHVTGECTCAKGWYGPSCDRPCPRDSFGEGCSRRCECSPDLTCHPVTGECLPGAKRAPAPAPAHSQEFLPVADDATEEPSEESSTVTYDEALPLRASTPAVPAADVASLPVHNPLDNRLYPNSPASPQQLKTADHSEPSSDMQINVSATHGHLDALEVRDSEAPVEGPASSSIESQESPQEGEYVEVTGLETTDHRPSNRKGAFSPDYRKKAIGQEERKKMADMEFRKKLLDQWYRRNGTGQVPPNVSEAPFPKASDPKEVVHAKDSYGKNARDLVASGHLMLPPPPTQSPPPSEVPSGLVPLVSVAGGLAALGVLVAAMLLLILCYRRRRKKPSSQQPLEMTSVPQQPSEYIALPAGHPVFFSPVYLPAEIAQESSGLILTALLNPSLQEVCRQKESPGEQYDIPQSVVRKRDKAATPDHVYEELPCWNTSVFSHHD